LPSATDSTAPAASRITGRRQCLDLGLARRPGNSQQVQVL
jgi:hypothetical protein